MHEKPNAALIWAETIRDTHREKARALGVDDDRSFETEGSQPDLDSQVWGMKRSTVCRITEATNMGLGNSKSTQNGGVESIEETRKRMFSRRPWVVGWH